MKQSGNIHEITTLYSSAWVAELVDARDLKSLEALLRESSILSLGTK